MVRRDHPFLFFWYITLSILLCSDGLADSIKTIMPGISYIQVSGKEILMVDYSGCKTSKMLEIFNEAKEAVLTKGVRCLILTDLSNTYITPDFLRHAEKEILTVKHLIIKNAFIGMSRPKRMILKGFVLLMGKKEFEAFDTKEQALEYLIKE